MRALRLALIGSPRKASPWLIQALGRAGTLEAVCDKEAEQHLGKTSARWAFAEVALLLKEAEPDGVVIARQPEERLSLIKECLSKGAHVLVPGAPAASKSCGRLVTLAKLAGRVVLAAPAIRYAPAVLLAKRLLDSGMFGEPISISLSSTRRGSAREPGEAGPVPTDQLFEAVDLLHQLLGPMQRVYAVGHADGAMMACGTAASGVAVSATFHANGAAEAVGLEFEMRSSDGARLIVDRDCRLRCSNGPRLDAVHGVGLAAVDPVLELGYEGLVADFCRVMGTGRSGLNVVNAPAEAVATVEAILASAARGRPMPVRTTLSAASRGRREDALEPEQTTGL